MVVGSSGQVQNVRVPTDFRKGTRTKIKRYMVAIAMPVAVKSSQNVPSEQKRQDSAIVQQYEDFVIKLSRRLQKYTEIRFCSQFCFSKSLSKILSNEPCRKFTRQELEFVIIIVHFYENWSFAADYAQVSRSVDPDSIEKKSIDD